MHDKRKIRRTPTPRTRKQLQPSSIADGGGNPPPPPGRRTGSKVKQGVLVRGDSRDTKIYVQGPCEVVVDHVHQGWSNRVANSRFEGDGYINIGVVQLVGRRRV